MEDHLIILNVVLFSNKVNNFTLLYSVYLKNNNNVIINFTCDDDRQTNTVFNLPKEHLKFQVIKLHVYNWEKTNWNFLPENRIASYTIFGNDADDDDANEKKCINLLKICYRIM